MYLKNIEVHGFKSFAQKINFEFHNGITGIVGPNGSGKSNVGDAVRWVLGEQSAKQLRGGNMQDVIFSGTETRKPLSFASVAITLDNSDHKLPVDYNEVTVTRRLYRSGESEYLINGSSCRLKDIQEMFYDTGIGKEGYSIIGQGQIDKILSGKPEDRRELFDEAAGIVKFKRRKNTTIKKLEEEKRNLVRVTDILNELTKQLGPLEKQAETAKIYLSRRDELRNLDVNLFLLEYDHAGRLLQELEDKLGNAEQELKETTEEFDRTKTEYDRLEKELEELNRHLDDLKEKQQENALQKQQYESRIKILEEQISAGKQNTEHYESRMNVLKGDLEKRNQEKEKLSGERTELRAQKKEIQKTLDEGQKQMEKILSNVEDCTRAVEDGKNEIIELLNSRATTKGKAQRFDAMMEQLEIRKAEISKKVLVLKTEEETLSGEKTKAEHTYKSVSSSIRSMNEECVRLDGEVRELQEKIKEQNKQMETGQAAYHREASRLESLKNITERYEGYGNSIRRVMEQKRREPGIRGVVADIIQVQKNYELAIETALGGSIQNIVTDNEQTAKRMIDFLKKNRYGRATFLPLSNISGKGGIQKEEVFREPGVIGAADTLVRAGQEYSSLVKYLLGRVLVVDHIDHAIAIGKKYHHSLRMVTLEGDSLSPGGSMTGGAFKNNSNLLGRRREMEELERSIGLLKKELEDMQLSIDENRSRRNILRDTIADFQEKLRRQYVGQNTAKMNLEQIEEKENSIRENYKQIEREQEELRRQAGEIRSDRSGIVRELEESQKDEEELETFIETKQKELEEWRSEETLKTKELEQVRLEESAVSQKERFLQENLDRIIQEIEDFTEESRYLRENLQNSKEETKKKQEGIQSLQDEVEKCENMEEEFRSRREKWQEEKEKRNASHKTFFEKRDHLSEKTALLDKECFRLRSQAEKVEEQREAQISYMWEEYEITPNSASQYRREELTDRQAMKKDIARIKEEIRRLGSVNVNAVEDYKNLLERHTFLSGQYEDLVEAEKALENIIQELDEGMRKQFSEKFRDIQREFDKAFKELFGGGKGTLELSEEEDILEAGIKIISQPPGKKLQNMMQLSGGEKALTAIALLFAIQNLKPSPFCLLDEIEAALDDSNVGRFASYLQKLTKNTQFIIITHRRGTMNAADRLYGITMQEKGVSTLVSVDLVENQLTK